MVDWQVLVGKQDHTSECAGGTSVLLQVKRNRDGLLEITEGNNSSSDVNDIQEILTERGG